MAEANPWEREELPVGRRCVEEKQMRTRAQLCWLLVLPFLGQGSSPLAGRSRQVPWPSGGSSDGAASPEPLGALQTHAMSICRHMPGEPQCQMEPKRQVPSWGRSLDRAHGRGGPEEEHVGSQDPE